MNILSEQLIGIQHKPDCQFSYRMSLEVIFTQAIGNKETSHTNGGMRD